MMTLQEGLGIVTQARRGLSGLGKRFRYVASHASGKIEIVGQAGSDLILRYHEARRPEDEGRLFAWPVERPLLWLDEPVQALR
jgi:L-lysine 2,3-aminomutase